MIDQLIAMHIVHASDCGLARTAQAEDDFYRKHGSDPFVRIVAWLTSITLHRKKDRASPARSPKTCGSICRDQAALRPLA